MQKKADIKSAKVARESV